MEFHNAHSHTGSYDLVSLAYFDHYSYFSQVSTPFSSGPNQSYTDQDHEEADTGVLEAITDEFISGSSNALDRILTGKKQFAAKTTQEILGLIYQREEIRYDHARAIDYESMQLKEKLFETGTWQTGLNPQLDKTRGQLQRELGGLERERRMEEVACWRDTTRLRENLREALRDFDQEKRKEQLITGYIGST